MQISRVSDRSQTEFLNSLQNSTNERTVFRHVGGYSANKEIGQDTVYERSPVFMLNLSLKMKDVERLII